MVFELRSDRGEVLRTFNSSAVPAALFPDVAPIWYLREMTTANVLGEGADLVWGLINSRRYFSNLTASSEWVLGQALTSIGGRGDEARTVLARAADQAPGTWIATSLT